MIYYITTNKLRRNCNALNLVRLAHCYKLDRLYWKCITRLLQDLNVDNFVITLNCFNKFEIKRGYGILCDFAKENVDKLKKRDDFNKLSHEFKYGVLRITD